MWGQYLTLSCRETATNRLFEDHPLWKCDARWPAVVVAVVVGAVTATTTTANNNVSSWSRVYLLFWWSFGTFSVSKSTWIFWLMVVYRRSCCKLLRSTFGTSRSLQYLRDFGILERVFFTSKLWNINPFVLRNLCKIFQTAVSILILPMIHLQYDKNWT